jgi:hypothetical protein
MSSEKTRTDGHVICYERLQNGPFYADFRRDNRLFPEVYHCIIQREGSTEILHWSQFRTLERAQSSAQRELRRFLESKAS